MADNDIVPIIKEFDVTLDHKQVEHTVAGATQAEIREACKTKPAEFYNKYEELRKTANVDLGTSMRKGLIDKGVIEVNQDVVNCKGMLPGQPAGQGKNIQR